MLVTELCFYGSMYGNCFVKNKNEPYQSTPGAKRQSLWSAMHTNHGGASEKIHVMSAMTIKTSSFFATPLFLDISKLRYVNYTVLHQGIYFPRPPPPKKKENTKQNIKIL